MSNKTLLLETLVDTQTAIEQFQDALDMLHNVLGANPLLRRHANLLNALKQADAAAENLFDETVTILEEEEDTVCERCGDSSCAASESGECGAP